MSKSMLFIVLPFFMWLTPVEAVMKFEPGHYYAHTDPSNLNPISLRLQEDSRWRGAILNVQWRDIESAGGDRNWSVIDNAIALVEQTGDYFGVQLMDREFSSSLTCSQIPVVPDDMIPWGQTELKRDGTGCVARIWTQGVMDRWIALASDFMARYDDHPTVVLVMLEETAIASIREDPDFTEQGYVDQLVRFHTEVGAASDHIALNQSMNFMPGAEVSLRQIADAQVLTGNGSVGTGDINNDDYWAGVNGEIDPVPGYVVIPEYKDSLGNAFLGHQAQVESGDTPDIINIVVDEMGARYKAGIIPCVERSQLAH